MYPIKLKLVPRQSISDSAAVSIAGFHKTAEFKGTKLNLYFHLRTVSSKQKMKPWMRWDELVILSDDKVWSNPVIIN